MPKIRYILIALYEFDILENNKTFLNIFWYKNTVKLNLDDATLYGIIWSCTSKYLSWHSTVLLQTVKKNIKTIKAIEHLHLIFNVYVILLSKTKNLKIYQGYFSRGSSVVATSVKFVIFWEPHFKERPYIPIWPLVLRYFELKRTKYVEQLFLSIKLFRTCF